MVRRAVISANCNICWNRTSSYSSVIYCIWAHFLICTWPLTSRNSMKDAPQQARKQPQAEMDTNCCRSGDIDYLYAAVLTILPSWSHCGFQSSPQSRPQSRVQLLQRPKWTGY